jgi:uncharacterized protein (TIGR02118 family)
MKVIVLLPRRADMSPEAFKQHLRETHLPLVTKLPGLRRLVLNWVLPDPNQPPPAYDAVAEDWFDDGAAMGAALATPEGQAVAADMPNFLDPSRVALLVVEERVAAMVAGVGVQVRHVQQQQCLGAVQQLGQERGLVQLGCWPLQQRSDMLKGERNRKVGLGQPDVGGQNLQRLPGAGNRQQMPGVQPAGPDEGHVLADQRCIQPVGHGGQVGDPGRVGLLGST